MPLSNEISVLDFETLSSMAVLPLADAYPLLISEESAELATDIDHKGILQPLVIFDGQLLDGRNRKAAVEAVNKARDKRDEAPLTVVPVRYFEGTIEEAEDLVIALNERRRDLTPGQRAIIANKHREIVAARAAARRRATQNNLSAEAEVVNSPPQVEESGKTREILAEKHGVGSQTIDRVQRLQRTTEEKMVDPDNPEEKVATPRAIKALNSLKAIETGRKTVNAAIEEVFKVVEINVDDDPVGTQRKKVNAAATNFKNAITELAKLSKQGADDYNFISNRITEVIAHFDKEFGVENESH